MEELYFEDEHLTLLFNQPNSLVRATWNGFLSGEKLHHLAGWCMHILDEKKPLYWLADNRKLKAIRKKDQEWLAANLMLRLTTSSLQKMATIISEDIFSQMAVEDLYTRINNLAPFEHQYFKSELPALNWLAAVQETC